MPQYKRFMLIGVGLALAGFSLAIPALAAPLDPELVVRTVGPVVGPAMDPGARPRWTGLASIAGSLDVAANSAAVRALAVDVQVTASDLFLVGDSTFVAAAGSIGFGSSFAGIGFAKSANSGVVNPLVDVPEGFDGLVVIGVSVWDGGVEDVSAYRDAVEKYRQAGYLVVVVEVPESYGHGPRSSPEQTAAYKALNAVVAEAVGCELQPWAVRDVETVGDLGDSDDYVHPSSAGVDQLLTSLAALVSHPCEPRLHG